MGISKVILFCVTVYLVSISNARGRKGFGPTDQEWGFVNVRNGAYMFYWLHYTNSSSNPTEKPLVIWLQGGPGASSTGYGNLGELGPIDEHLNIREHAWTNNYNVLFVDNPVGSGFSYVDDDSKLVKNNNQIALDFLVFSKQFFNDFPQFSTTPLYIFCESYGGKMTAEIALLLYKAQNYGEINCNLKGIGLGDSWISPEDSVLTWGSYLLNQGLVDETGFEKIQNVAEKASVAIQDGNWKKATDLFNNLEEVVQTAANNVDFYNVLTKVSLDSQKLERKRNLLGSVGTIDEDAIGKVMNYQVRNALNVGREWVNESPQVFDALSGDFMKPAIEIVERLLNETTLKVIVYSGQLDLIVDTPGTIRWVDNLKWKGARDWKNKKHETVIVNDIVEGFYKNVGSFTFYWVSRAGHMVPYDNPNCMDFILNKTIEN